MLRPPPSDYPITGICIVSDPQKCPPGYELLYRSFDKKDDCDLWKDSFFRSKITRYLCVTRLFPLEGGRLNNVLADVVLQNERDPPPSGFTLMDFTVDTREKATRKKEINVKMIPRSSTNSAINDLIILSRNKRAPPGYTLIGEMNGLVMCYRMGTVPEDTKDMTNVATQNGQPRTNSLNTSLPGGYAPIGPWLRARPWSYCEGYNPWSGSNNNEPSKPPECETNWQSGSNSPVTTANSVTNSPQRAAPAPPIPARTHNYMNHGPLKREGSIIAPSSALTGVPFKLNPIFQDVTSVSSTPGVNIHYRSLSDIENEYKYSFRVERSAAQRMSSFNYS